MKPTLLMVIAAFALVGCAQEAEVERPLYDWSATVAVENAPGVVDSVLVLRGHDGKLHSRWFTQLADGSKAMITLGRWAPKPEEDIPHGPMAGQVGSSEVTVRQGVLTHGPSFSDKGQPHTPGEYYLELFVRADSGAWSQPQPTVRLLTEFGEVGKYGGHQVRGLARFTLPAFRAAGQS